MIETLQKTTAQSITLYDRHDRVIGNIMMKVLEQVMENLQIELGTKRFKFLCSYCTLYMMYYT